MQSATMTSTTTLARNGGGGAVSRDFQISGNFPKWAVMISWTTISDHFENLFSAISTASYYCFLGHKYPKQSDFHYDYVITLPSAHLLLRGSISTTNFGVALAKISKLPAIKGHADVRARQPKGQRRWLQVADREQERESAAKRD